jgi:hypothetical protein
LIRFFFCWFVLSVALIFVFQCSCCPSLPIEEYWPDQG